MSRILPPARSTTPAPRRLKRGASLAALGLAVSLAPTAFAQNQPFNTMVGMQAGRVIGPNGQVSQWTGARTPVVGTTTDGRPLMSIEQTEQKALLDWEDFRLKTNEVLEFQQQSADWIAVNRVHGQHASQVDGEIRAIGKVFIFNDNGVLVGKDAQINTRTLVTGTGFADVIVDGNTTTLVQTQQKGKLDWHTTSTAPGVWSNLSVQTGETLKFQQQSPEWFVVNRVVLRNALEGGIAAGDQSSKINGEISAAGDVFIFNDQGVVFNADPAVTPNDFRSVENRLRDGRVMLGETGAKVSANTLVTGAGFSDVFREGKTTTLVQSREKATLDWSNLSLSPDRVLLFRQEDKRWIALNRAYSSAVTRMAGDIKALGNIYLVAPNGLSIDGSIEVQQLVLSSLHMRNDQLENGLSGGLVSYGRNYNDRMDPTFSNTWGYHMGDNSSTPFGQPGIVTGTNFYDLMKGGPEISDPNDPLKYNVTIGSAGKVKTGEFGKVILAGPAVTNKGAISVQDEGQVILAAGENVYFSQLTSLGAATRPGMLSAHVGAFNPLAFWRANIPYRNIPQTAAVEEWRAFYSLLLGREVQLGETLSSAEHRSLTASGFVGGTYMYGGLIGNYLNTMQVQRANENGFIARNEGLISAKRGGSVDFRGLNLQQMGAVDMTSTALFRSNVTFRAIVSDYLESQSDSADGPVVPGHGHVVFGKGSLTQITPDLDATDMIPVSSGKQNVGEIRITANNVHMQENALIHMPSGKVNIALDAATHVYNNHIGQGANQGNEDGTRFLMDKGATIDLSGWDVTLEMGYHQVSGRLFAAQLSDAPVQQDGQLYRKTITVDRRYGTNVANWESFDNLSQGTLAQFLTGGGTFDLYVGDDFIMKPGSVIDVSGGVTTYKDGYVYTTLLRRLDGSVIDIREADPDELYMGLANEWVVYSTKWGKQKNYYIPLMSSARGKWEQSYQHGGSAGQINVLAPDAVLQGTLKGETVTGKYQRANPLKGGVFSLNAHAGNEEGEYVSENLIVTAQEDALNASFEIHDRLSDVYGDLFGEEFEFGIDPAGSDSVHQGNTTLTSADFFNRSTMGDYQLAQRGRSDSTFDFPPSPGIAVTVEAGANLNLQHGASLSIEAEQRMEFLGSIKTEGGNVSLSAMSLKFADDSRIDTRGSWYSDYEVLANVPLTSTPRIHGGNISLSVATDSSVQRPAVGDIEFT
ncbi:MAG: filamentous hemagglutinin N-terminal domain-containing protein, partial [Burkholderiales bacterium]